MVDICMLVTSDLDRDPRVQKEAASASAAGFSVKVLCREATVEIPGCDIQPLRLGRAGTRLAKYIERGRLNVKLAREAIRARPRLLHANDLDTLPAALWAARR
ncbi:MAG: hypothetical protein FJY92_12490, partial [Candidatus Hydrogenedentes bacterium]|nr:hypothetical protein [Candidatus Hydrogenedentota bacterium]